MRHRWSKVFTGLNCRGICGAATWPPSIPDTLDSGNLVRTNETHRTVSRSKEKKPASARTRGSLMNRITISLKAGQKVVAILLNVTLTLGTLTAVSTPVFASDDSAKKLFLEGQAAEAREDYDAAYEFFRKAYAKNPNDLRM